MGESLSEYETLTWSGGMDLMPKAAWGSAKGPLRCISLACGSCSTLMLYFVGSSLGLDLRVEVVLGMRTYPLPSEMLPSACTRARSASSCLKSSPSQTYTGFPQDGSTPPASRLFSLFRVRVWLEYSGTACMWLLLGLDGRV